MKSARTRLIGWIAGAMNWVSDHLCYAALSAPIGWRDWARWRIEAVLQWLFRLAYDGSDEEILDVFDWGWDADEDALTPRQRMVRRVAKEARK